MPLLAVTKLTGQTDNFISYADTVPTSYMPNLSISEQALIWPANNYLAINIEGSESKFYFRYDNDYPYRYTAEGKQCRWFRYQKTELARLSCNGAEVLLDDQTPLLFSDADYNLPNVQVVNRFSINNQDYYTVMLALKAYTAYGVLTKEHGKWRFIVKPADWASIC